MDAGIGNDRTVQEAHHYANQDADQNANRHRQAEGLKGHNAEYAAQRGQRAAGQVDSRQDDRQLDTDGQIAVCSAGAKQVDNVGIENNQHNLELIKSNNAV